MRVEVPAGSALLAQTAGAEIRGKGVFGESKLQSAGGSIQLDRTGALNVAISNGTITVDHADGPVEIDGSSGSIRIGEIDGSAIFKSANCDIWVGQANRNLTLSTANGVITVDSAASDVTAKTAKGAVRVGRVRRGQINIMTASGDIEIGIGQGTAARVDAQSKTGTVQNSLAPQDNPEKFAETVEVRTRTQSGDIKINRAPADRPSLDQ